MTQPSVALFSYGQKTNTQIRDDLLRSWRNGFIALGNPNPNVGPGSDYYILATAIGNEIAVAQANSVIRADDNMPDTAAGASLDRWLAVVKLTRSGATNSFGVITITVSASATLILTGQQLIDNAGLLYQVTTGGSYANGATVPVASISTGSATNHANGDTLTWVTAPAFCAQNVSVGTSGGDDGLEGGTDSEVGNDEPPRARLLSKLQNPPRGGNWSDIVGWATASTPDVQSAFSYPALLGPATTFFAVCGNVTSTPPLTSTAKNRDLPTPLVTGTVLPYVLGQLSEHALCVGTSVANQPTDVAILLALPAAPTASPAGPGGGWVDGSPWPNSLSSGTLPVTVTSVTNSTQFTVDAVETPTAGVSHISWINPANWTLYTATVTGIVAGSGSGAWEIQLSSPFPGIANGSCIFPASVNQLNYMAALLAAFATMGPGEWLTSASSLFGRAFRHPSAAQSAPSVLGAPQLRIVINSGPEVGTASYIFTGTVATATSFNAPTVPSTITVDPTTNLLTSAPPNILVPANLSFYAK